MTWRNLRLLSLVAAILLLAGTQGTAQPAHDPATDEQQPAAQGILSLLPEASVTDHRIDLDGEELAYRATAGTLTLRDGSGQRAAEIFYTAYTLPSADTDDRPLTFVFNGGPGAASTYLHLGLVGPWIADFGTPPDGARARLRPNPQTWLKFTDLVLIDPVGTGWSRAAESDKAESFWSIDEDARSLAKAVALYLAEARRGQSPLYLLGESYGGFRAVKLARSLQREQGVVVSGIVMVSPFLEGALHFGTSRLALPAALLLPSLAATQLDRQGRFTPEALVAAENFAMSDYLVTLAGPIPQGASGEAFYGRLAEMTGLPVEVVRRTRGFISEAYLEHSDDEVAEIVSPYDATFAMSDPFPASDDGHSGDPILDGYLQRLGGLFVGYARNELKYETEMTYELLNREVNRKWDWNGSRRGRLQASATSDLRRMLALNPSFRVLIAHGRSDLVTPYGVSRYALNHLPQVEMAERTQLEVYKGGHMFYFDPASRAAFTAEAGAFYHQDGL